MTHYVWERSQQIGGRQMRRELGYGDFYLVGLGRVWKSRGYERERKERERGEKEEASQYNYNRGYPNIF